MDVSLFISFKGGAHGCGPGRGAGAGNNETKRDKY